MATSTGNIDICKVSLGSISFFSKISLGNNVVYSAGNTVTYHVDTDVVYQEEVDADETVLSPKTFIPFKAGWEFVGWRQDAVASDDVLNSLTMADEPITLYAVFRQAVTVTCYNPNLNNVTGYKYYNNTNMVNPRFSLTPASYAGWTFRGWTKSTNPAGDVSYTSINNTEIVTSITIYQTFQMPVNVTLNGIGTYYLTAYTNGITTQWPSLTVDQPQIAGWVAYGWSTSNAAGASAIYGSISGTTFTASTTLYGLYYRTISLSYYGNGAETGSVAVQYGNIYYNNYNVFLYPTFVLSNNGFTRSGYTFSGWLLNGSGGAYGVGSSITLTDSATMYAYWVGTPYTLYLDTSGWTTYVSGGTFASGPNVTAAYGGVGVQGKQAGYAFAIGGIYKNIDTHGCTKVDITLGALFDKYSYATLGGVTIVPESSSDRSGGTVTANISTASQTQRMDIIINCAGDTYNSKEAAIVSLYFHN